LPITVNNLTMSRISIKTKSEIDIIREGGKILAEIRELLRREAKPGVTGDYLDELAEKEIRKAGGEPSFKNYASRKGELPFPASICFSINDEIVHGIPYGKVLKEGDIVGIDLGMKYKNLFTDSAVTAAVGKINPKLEKLLEATEKSLMAGIAQVKPGNRINDIGAAIQKYAEEKGFSVVRDLGGHGVGLAVHEDPFIPNFRQKDRGAKIMAGMVVAIEPMLNIGSHYVKLDKDGWTIKTADGKCSAHFEHTVAVTEKGYEILTMLS